MNSYPEQQRQGGLPVEHVVCPDSLDRALLDVATQGEPGDGDDRWRLPMLGRHDELQGTARWTALARDAYAEAVPAESAGEIDAEEVAAWITGQYRQPAYPAVLLGSPHGGAIHLAAALGAAWLPTSFPVTLSWPGGSAGDWAAAMDWGATLTGKILAGNPDVTVRQVHDPVQRGLLCGATVSLRVRWRTLPAAYVEFLRTRLRPGGATMLLRDLRTWPVLEGAAGHTFQIGSPASGWSHADYGPDLPAFRQLLDSLGVDSWQRPHHDAPAQYAETGGDPAIGPRLRELATAGDHPTHRVLYGSTAMLSACLADLYREHLCAGSGEGRHCLVETGRLLDPRGVLQRGLVPYWCESAALSGVGAAEWWLAGSERFDSVTVLPEPPGTRCDAHAGLIHWRSLAAFGRRNGRVDRLAAGRYPMLPIPGRHAVRVVDETAEPLPPAPLLTMAQVVGALRLHAPALGLLIG